MSFPLPLAPFEEYMLAENTAEYPRVFFVEVALSGTISRPAMETAWAAVLARHPLLTARLDRKRGKWRWIIPEEAPPPAIDWGGPEAPLAYRESEFIDLAREPGIRAWLRADEHTARLILEFHHSCCDGVASLRFVGELLAAYARQTDTTGAAPELPTLDSALLAGRGTFGLTRPSFGEWLHHARVTASESWRLMGRRIAPVHAEQNGRGDSHAWREVPRLETHRLSPAEFEALKATTREHQATLNDLLLCQLFRTIAQWNEEQRATPRGWMRINVPTNLRRPEDDAMPAANVMSFTFVDRRPRECRDGRALLASIRDETEAIKRGRLGLYFIGQLGILSAIPGCLPLVLGGRRCFASAVLTNVGDPTKQFLVDLPRREGKVQVGNLTLENISGSPPLRARTRVGIGVTFYAGQLTLSALGDRHCLSSEQTREFLERYVAQLRSGL